MRTHGVRPSEKSGPGVIPGFSSQGHLALDGPPCDGAGSARPRGRVCLHRAIASLRHLLFALLPVIMTCLGLSPALACGRGDRAPPRKTPFASSRGPPPQGHPGSDSPPRGGAGSARPQGRLGPHRGISLLGPGPLAQPSRVMKSLGLSSVLACGRGDRVPPRKSPFASSPAPTPLGHPPPIVHPRGGRAPHARKECFSFHREIAPLGHEAFVCPR